MIAEIILAAALVQQADPCVVGAGASVLTSGAPFTLTWVMDAQVPASPTDPTFVPQRINGFVLQIDGGAKQDIAPTSGPPCSAGSLYAGHIPYSYRSVTGVSKGAHSATVTAWNFILDDAGNPTYTRQEGPAVSVPFSAVDLMRLGPPSGAKNVIIRK
jgi:hypothetical protein